MAETETLEQKANRLYQFIYDHLKEYAKSPTHREMAEGTHMSTETIQKCLNLLETQGRGIHRIRGRARQVWVPIRDLPEEV